MRRAYFSQWFTAGRVLLTGLFAAVLFFWRPWEQMAPVSTAQILIAAIAVATGVKLGFSLATRKEVRAWLFRVAPEHYTLAGAVGFIFGALWVGEGNSVWPLVVWFLPAAILEGLSSSISLTMIENAS
jgi:hypothetical protein